MWKLKLIKASIFNQIRPAHCSEFFFGLPTFFFGFRVALTNTMIFFKEIIISVQFSLIEQWIHFCSGWYKLCDEFPGISNLKKKY